MFQDIWIFNSGKSHLIEFWAAKLFTLIVPLSTHDENKYK